jgi:hypothetical protein
LIRTVRVEDDEETEKEVEEIDGVHDGIERP